MLVASMFLKVPKGPTKTVQSPPASGPAALRGEEFKRGKDADVSKVVGI